MYRSASEKLASLEARISRLENSMSKKAGHQVAPPHLINFQVKELKEAFGHEADVFVLEPLVEFPSTHAIKVVTISQQGYEVSVDFHMSFDIIVEIACVVSSTVNKRVAYAKPTLNKVMGQNFGFEGEKLNYRSAGEVALIITNL